jgi:AcrR family transcriptional regulator
VRALSITELERATGTARSTIYYYVRSGLLPPAQKSSPSRALYTDDHVELLREVQALKNEGLGLDAIRERLASRVDAANENGVDLVARQTAQTRAAILQAAALQFARRGYRQTRIADIIAELRITPQVLYSHFATKRDLFAACYRVFIDAMTNYVEPQIDQEADHAVHLIWRMWADYGLDALNPDLLALARDAAYDDPETSRDLRAAYQRVLEGPTADITKMRVSAGDPPLSDELVSYALFGAFHTMRMRASWDDRFSRSDVMWTEVVMHLAVAAVYGGAVDVAALRERYQELIDKVAEMPPPVPPEFAP